MSESKILLVEDDPDFSQIVKDSLELTGNYDVLIAENAIIGYEAYKTFMPDLIVSDVEMPEMSGLEMVKKIREEDELTPIILASAKTDPKDIAKGFRMEIDNYIKKPYLPAELDLHIKAILRRVKKEKKFVGMNIAVYKIGSYFFDSERHILKWNHEETELTVRESQILKMLYQQKGNIIKREKILLQYWGMSDFYTSRSLDVFISKLRKYLRNDTSIQIQTIRGEGLMMIFDEF